MMGCMDRPLGPPSWRQRSRELRLGLDVGRAALRAPTLRGLPRGDGAPVLLIPGFGAGDASMIPLRSFLRRLGHDARPAGLGRVGDDVEALVARVVATTAELADRHDRAPALVGWSIGGVIAREVAREAPQLVRRVITFGTPVVGGPGYTALAVRYGRAELARVQAQIDERAATPITVPVTGIWSTNDGIVTPAACIDHHTIGIEHVQVTSTHLGMGLDPDVWAVVARRLADV